MTDHLALIAARTAECLVYDGNGECVCKGLGRVLDERLKGLREDCNKTHRTSMGLISTCEQFDCPGYTVVRDLAALLEIALKEPNSSVNFIHSVENDGCEGWIVDLAIGNTFTQDAISVLGNTPLEAVAKAFWEYLEQEEKVTS